MGGLWTPKSDYVIYVRILITIPKVVADWKFAAMVIDRWEWWLNSDDVLD